MENGCHLQDRSDLPSTATEWEVEWAPKRRAESDKKKKLPLVEFIFSIQIIITIILPKLGKYSFNPLIFMLFVLCIFSNVVIFTSTEARTA